MRKRYVELRLAVLVGAVALGAGAAAGDPSGCPRGVSAATEYVALCVRSEKRQRAVTMRTGEGAQLSAGAGLEVFACERGGRSCKSVKTLFGEGEYFRPTSPSTSRAATAITAWNSGSATRPRKSASPGRWSSGGRTGVDDRRIDVQLCRARQGRGDPHTDHTGLEPPGTMRSLSF
jgi:hypothetical protein